MESAGLPVRGPGSYMYHWLSSALLVAVRMEHHEKSGIPALPDWSNHVLRRFKAGMRAKLESVSFMQLAI